MILKRNVLLAVSLAMLVLSLVFLAWVLQLPSYSPVQPSEYRPAVGRVEVNVVSTPTPAATASPEVVEYCSSYPQDLRQACEEGLQQSGGSIPSSSEECELLPEELREECVQNSQ